jgi:hypothetical protein
MKKITITLTDKAEEVFNEIMYALPREEDGTGMCTQSQAICHALEMMWEYEQAEQATERANSPNEIQMTMARELINAKINIKKFDPESSKYKCAQSRAQLLEKLLFESPTHEPMSDERIDELWTKNRGSYNVIFNRRDFGIFLKELTCPKPIRWPSKDSLGLKANNYAISECDRLGNMKVASASYQDGYNACREDVTNYVPTTEPESKPESKRRGSRRFVKFIRRI